MCKKDEIICHSWQEVIDQVNSLPEDQDFNISWSMEDDEKECADAGED